jgi:hypothetical protein
VGSKCWTLWSRTSLEINEKGALEASLSSVIVFFAFHGHESMCSGVVFAWLIHDQVTCCFFGLPATTSALRRLFGDLADLHGIIPACTGRKHGVERAKSGTDPEQHAYYMIERWLTVQLACSELVRGFNMKCPRAHHCNWGHGKATSYHPQSIKRDDQAISPSRRG